tara:strand:+ start:266 stop:856 length:591 start_codon:yes stop_codon:yes gene_type:complete
LPDDVIRTVTNRSQGYYSVVTKFYSDSETNTTQDLAPNTWTQLNVSELVSNLNDFSPTESKNIPDGSVYGDGNGIYDSTNDRFSLAGLEDGSHCIVRVLLRCDPEEDESQLDIRLRFQTNPATVAGGLTEFSIETIMLSMTQGADRWYADEDLISFFVSDSLSGTNWDNSGSFVVEGRSTVACTVEMLGLTLMMDK